MPVPFTVSYVSFTRLDLLAARFPKLLTNWLATPDRLSGGYSVAQMPVMGAFWRALDKNLVPRCRGLRHNKQLAVWLIHSQRKRTVSTSFKNKAKLSSIVLINRLRGMVVDYCG
jgi:hypothetical protein